MAGDSQAEDLNVPLNGPALDFDLKMLASDFEFLFPLPFLPLPMKPSSQSSRLRQRFKRRLELRNFVNELILFLNQMHDGQLRYSRGSGPFCPLDVWTVAQRAVLERLVIMARSFFKAAGLSS